MKIIVTYASAGAGHYKAARAIYGYFKEHCQQTSLEIIDILEKCLPLLRFSYTRGYLFLVKHGLFIWQFSFLITAFRPLRIFNRPIARIINRLSTKAFAEYLIQEQPDYIISTHFLPSEIAACLKKQKKINSRIITVITDFGVHPYWISEPVDNYIAASEYTKKLLISEHIEESKIRALGIPVDEKLLQPYDKNILCAKFKIQPDKFTVLISTGSFGIGPIEEIVRLLHNDVQILVVCARNKKLKLRLQRLVYSNVSIFGFIDNMPELMAISDLIITKPGGLTIAEILAMELVPILICPIPGQEMENARVIEHFGAGQGAGSLADIKNLVLDFKAHPNKIRQIKENIRKIKKPQALEELYNVVCKNSGGPGC